jgi:hypothetical protein
MAVSPPEYHKGMRKTKKEPDESLVNTAPEILSSRKKKRK